MACLAGIAGAAILLVTLTAPVISAPAQNEQSEQNDQYIPEEEPVECPAAVVGVELSLREVAGGAILEFTAPNKQHVDDLQLLLREAAAILEYQSKITALHAKQQGSTEKSPLPPVDIAVKPTAAGILLTIRAEEPGDEDAVLEVTRAFKEFWDSNECIAGKVSSA